MVIRLAFAIALICNGLLLSGQQLERFTFEHPQMGTLFRIIMYAEDSLKAYSASEAAFKRIDELNGVLSNYLEDSEISRLSAKAGSGEWVEISTDLWNVLLAAQKVSDQTSGAFDVSIGPLSKLWRRAIRRQELPATEEIQAAKALVNFRNIKLDATNQRACLAVKGMLLDAGGIGKGYAADEVLTLLRNRGITRALIDAGGDILTGDPPPGKAGWTITGDVEKANGSNETGVATLSNAAIATSGDTYRYLEAGGQRFSHIIDPRTGMGLTHQVMVTVIASSGMMADALASAFSIVEEGELAGMANQLGFEIQVKEKNPGGVEKRLLRYMPSTK